MTATTSSNFEIEQKYAVDDVGALEEALRRMGGIEGPVQNHRDQYFNHPSRDFAQTKEAFRVRRVDGVPMVTYKGAQLPGVVKARRELEWRLDPGDPEGRLMEELLVLLGFRPVAAVEKQRRPFKFEGELADVAIVIDQVATLGTFAEIELIASHADQIDIRAAANRPAGKRAGIASSRTPELSKHGPRAESCEYPPG